MSCKVELSRKDPQETEGFSSKLNEEFLKIFNDSIEGTNTSQKYLVYKGKLDMQIKITV